MARPKNADAAVTRRRILSAAARLVAEAGPDGVSMRAIATTAGVAAATVHHYFGTKEELITAATEEVWAGLSGVERELAGALQGDDDLHTIIDKSVRVAFAWARAHTDAVRLIMRGLVERGGLDAEGRSDLLIPFIGHTSILLSAATGRPPGRVRLELTSVVSLIVRYAMAEPAQLRAALGVVADEHDDEAVLRAVANHLVDLAQRLLRIRPLA